MQTRILIGCVENFRQNCLYRSQKYETSFSRYYNFRLSKTAHEAFFVEQVVFDVYSTASTFTGSYDTVVLNMGNGWNTLLQKFVAPQTGIYYLSYSLGIKGGNQFWATLVVNGGTNYCDNELDEVTHSGLDLPSRGCLINLFQGDTAQPVPNGNYADSSYSESSFRGFLYSPVQGVQVRQETQSMFLKLMIIVNTTAQSKLTLFLYSKYS